MISWKKHYRKGLVALGFLMASLSINAQDANNGKELFKQNCTACHALDKQVVGPALGGVVSRLEEEQGLGADWLKKWIKDNEALRASGDAYANEVYQKYDKQAMTAFPNLSESDIEDILEYTTNPPAEEEKEEAGVSAEEAAAQLEAQKASEQTSTIMLISLLAIGGLLVWLLVKLRQLVQLQRSEELTALDKSQAFSFGEFYDKYENVGKALLAILAFFAFYGVWNWLMWIGVYKGYQPDQPIYFSHKIHVGENNIDCQLCHSSAKYGKVSEIPSANVCMNCHRLISEYNGDYMEPGKDKAFYDGQIQKIYTAVGWDAENQKYTGKTKPIEWTRIHNMPDFVYFNHSQHVIAGEKAIVESHNRKNPEDKIDVVCKACHGKIDTMNVVQMANDFTMGWCIECHRTTEIDMSNAYNQAYFKGLHEKLKEQYPSSEGKITVDAIGGIECGKCHY